MLTIRTVPLITYLGALYVLLASIVILSPSHEIPIWWVLSAVVFLPSIAITIIAGNAIEKLLAVTSLLFVALLPFGFPGTLLGWSGSLLLGLQCGRIWFRQFLNGRIDLMFWTLAIAPIFCTKILLDLATVGISEELLSNFFQAASINYANSILLGSASLVGTCMILQDLSISKGLCKIKNLNSLRTIALFLMPISLVFVLVTDYRSGVIGISGLLIFYMTRFSKSAGYSLFAVVAISLVFFYEYILFFLVPGRDNVGELFTELVDEDNRFYRAIKFAGRVLTDKSDFANWVNYFSVSALTDFLAVTFPLSVAMLIYFLIYFKSIFKLVLSRMHWEQRVSLLLILGSGLAVSLLQPDFFNMFVFGFQISLINSYVRFRSSN
jgi:hypothetical protein